MRRHLIRLASVPFISSHLANCYVIPFAVCNAWQRSRTRNLRRVGENSGPVLSCLGPKFGKFSDDVRDPSYFPKLLTGWLYRVPFKRYSLLTLKVIEKPNRCIVFGPQFLEGRSRLLYGKLLSRFTVHRLAEFGWVPFADLRLRSLTIKQNAELM